MGEYYCTNCGADLDCQPGFDPSKGYWTCTECGTLMTDPDDPDLSSDVTWFCDECGACLNKQYGFSDAYSSWTCTECGHTNPINDDEIYESEAAFQEEKARREQHSFFSSLFDTDDTSGDDDESEDEEDDDDDDDDSSSYSSYSSYESSDSSSAGSYSNYSSGSSYHSVGIIDSIKEFFSNVWKWMKRLFVFTIILCVIWTGWHIYDFFAKKEAERLGNRIAIGISSTEVIGEEYTSVEKELEEARFKYISSYELNDLDYSDADKVGTIDKISVDGDETFSSTSKYDKEDSIVIYYHSLKKVKPPMTPKEAKRQNYEDVVKAFENSGFGNIKTEKDQDLVTGWITKDGTVESISINGETKYEDVSYKVDSEIIITYHTFKDK